MDWAEEARTGRDQTGLRSTGLGRVGRRDWATAERGLGRGDLDWAIGSGLGCYLRWPGEKLTRLAKNEIKERKGSSSGRPSGSGGGERRAGGRTRS
ncbi:hypothetical protein CDL15_Pgr024014 [Punica granatum]|uniref:Uncharacterized protein n=1 Tax=Punica granatum TaxID=22663 RepID=A0A218XWH2_PUNGR|nr:hypothetical protein CDL15_Pgr024014 [Punica granatum]